jgi:ketosteroid isomerase-like protein
MVCVVLLGLPALAAADTADEVIELTYQQWAAEIAGDMEASAEILADGYTEFNPNFPTRIDGKATNMKMVEAMAEGGGSMLVGEMANARVQVYGDVAILTYNFLGVGQNEDGETAPTAAKSTRVYARIDGDWKLVHANFAPVSMDDD